MCRNIRTLHNFDPPATEDEIHASALQFVRKLCGFTKPSQANQEPFDRAVEEVAHVAHHLLDSLVTTSPARDRAVEAMKRQVLSAKRFGPPKRRNQNAITPSAGRSRFANARRRN